MASKKSTKAVVSESVSQSVAVQPSNPNPPSDLVGALTPAPEVGAPSPPHGNVASAQELKRGATRVAAQVEGAPGMAKELEANPEGYLEVVGAHAPPAADVVSAFKVAAGWSAEKRKTETWRKYVRTQETRSWGVCLELVR